MAHDFMVSRPLGWPLAFQRYAGLMKASGLLWTTRPSQVNCRDARYSRVSGVARTILSELLRDFATLKIDGVNDATLQALVDVFVTFQKRNKEAEIDRIGSSRYRKE